MLSDILQTAFIVSLLSAMIRIATPLIFAAIGELITERSGVLNLGVEGSILTGAFVGFTVTYHSGSLWLGVIMALVAGGILGLLMVFLSTTLEVDQTVTGLTINLLAAGLTFYIYRIQFKSVGSSNLPNLPIFQVMKIPILCNIPILGEILFSQYALTYISFALVAVVWFFLYKTKHGLILRSIGENPRAIDMKGVNIHLYQYLAVIFGSMMAGVAGAFLTLSSAGIFVPAIAGGRGWIAIALVIFGDWKPVPILLGALFFGFLDSFQQQIQGIGIQFPYQILLAMPYVLVIIALIVGYRRSGAPISLGKSYHRE